MPQVLTTKARFSISPTVPLAHRLHYGVSSADGSVTTYFDVADDVNLSGVYEVLESVGHKGPPFKEGGPFRVRRFSVNRGLVSTSYLKKWTKADPFLPGTEVYEFTGGKTLNLSFDSSAPPLLLDETYLKSGYDASSFPTSDLSFYGAKAYHKFAPLNPGVKLGVSLSEGIRDGLPQIPLKLFNRLKSFRSLGSEYLNVEFGWLPFLSDLRGVYSTWNGLNSRLAQIIRDNGRAVRRRGLLSRSISNVIAQIAAADQFGTPNHLGGQSFDSSVTSSHDEFKCVKTVRTSEEVWFAGRFRYYIPDVTDDRWTGKAKLALFGLTPSPSLLYEAMPWSWLIDWFSNVGDVISNLSSNGIADLTLDYGYLMREYNKLTTYACRIAPMEVTDPFGGGRPSTQFPPSNYARTTVLSQSKERIAATPFGFGVQIGDLSVRQLAILSALGLSRSNF